MTRVSGSEVASRFEDKGGLSAMGATRRFIPWIVSCPLRLFLLCDESPPDMVSCRRHGNVDPFPKQGVRRKRDYAVWHRGGVCAHLTVEKKVYP
jgi:hypothetical protein